MIIEVNANCLFCLIEIDETREIDITDSFVREDYKFLKKSKRTILIFKRTY